ncbi:hypothetical protein NC652_021461 [Populus alba x Populus x berolinensis]|nr:hypothetical protein NC652_021461 [Populus alba x Populus x berolinensis]
MKHQADTSCNDDKTKTNSKAKDDHAREHM